MASTLVRCTTCTFEIVLASSSCGTGVMDSCGTRVMDSCGTGVMDSCQAHCGHIHNT